MEKTLKTTIAADLAVSVAAGVPFLGKFDVYRRRSVAFISGESGEHTLQETFLRIAKARGVARCRSRSQSGSMAPGGDPSPARRACRL